MIKSPLSPILLRSFLIIQPTEALIAIDVNTGKAISKKKDVEKTFLKVNMEAVEEIARQLRLRNLSGMILIDFIDMKSKDDEKELLQVMQHYLNGDSKKAVAVDIFTYVKNHSEKNSLTYFKTKNFAIEYCSFIISFVNIFYH